MRKFKTDVVLPAGADVSVDRLRAALESLHVIGPATVDGAGSVSVRTGVTVKSFGEVVTCTVVPTDGGVRVHVESRSSVGTTLFDYGANKRNVRHVVAALGGVTA